MSDTPEADGLGNAPSPSALCFGETLVDLICPVRGVGFEGASSYTPHLGGAPTNVAIVAAALGVNASVAGGVGTDQWGDWIARRLREEGVGLRHWQRLAGVSTVVAFIVIDEDAVPDYLIYGDGLGPLARAFAPHVDEAVADAGLVVIASNTMVREEERAVTMELRERALAAGVGVLFDANLRLDALGRPGPRDRPLSHGLRGRAPREDEPAGARAPDRRARSRRRRGGHLRARSAQRARDDGRGWCGAARRGARRRRRVPGTRDRHDRGGRCDDGSVRRRADDRRRHAGGAAGALQLGAFLAARATEVLGALGGAALAQALVETDRRGLTIAS